MKPNLRAWLLSTSMSLLTGCSMTPPKTFTFQADVPENFTVTGTANYKPAPGETCIPPSGEAFTTGSLFFKPEQPKTAHQVEFKVPLTDDDHGCSMVLRGLKLKIEGQWGKRERDMSLASAGFSVSDEPSAQPPATSTPQAQYFNGQCQWLFRTVGSKQVIRKILQCRALGANGDMEKRMIGGRLHRDKLANSTVRLVLSVANREEPYYTNFWIETQKGWKACTGLWGTPNEELCTKPYKFLKSFKMPDGRDCTVYPTCTE
ncbi:MULTISPECIES: hypothetical protein [unclassified Pseudomonas]|uniref:hypothetical protein n=1 Tax=unclassified Pseudomonas TaxID=196821 RepID=UPI0021CC5E00|nr:MULTISPECIES: hypothetical protein [unclassified Pseudomonas]